MTVQLLVLALMALVGLFGWRLLTPHLRRLQQEETSVNGAWLWLVGFLAQIGVVTLMRPDAPMAPDGAADGALAAAPVPLERFVTLQALAGVLSVGLMLVLIGWRERSMRGLGLRVQRGPPALLVAVSGWLMFSPCFMVVTALNEEVLKWFHVADGRQALLRAFVDQPLARSSVLAWTSMVLLMPFCEEVFFRGALYGGLRRLLHPVAAIALSALMFGLAHEPTALLPTAALGAFLAFLYERTGSLSAPILFHALHNGVTLFFVANYPERFQ